MGGAGFSSAVDATHGTERYATFDEVHRPSRVIALTQPGFCKRYATVRRTWEPPFAWGIPAVFQQFRLLFVKSRVINFK